MLYSHIRILTAKKFVLKYFTKINKLCNNNADILCDSITTHPTVCIRHPMIKAY